MTENFETYESIRDWKDTQILQYQTNTNALNQFHDCVMKCVFNLAVKRVNQGNPPCLFTWFITGSGGRTEQGIISDQDHGLVFEDDTKASVRYFRGLGVELSYGLYMAGYPYCEGKVMSSNPLWCRTINDWKQQLLQWMEEESWEAIRYLQIFYDARSLIGNNQFVEDLKTLIDDFQLQDMGLFTRFLENVMLVKRGIGPFGQLIVEDKGKYEGAIDLKHVAFNPYVNAIRLLAIKEGLHETSTLERIEVLIKNKGYSNELRNYQSNFERLLEYRNHSYRHGNSYEESHFLSMKNVNKNSKKELKNILKDGKKLLQFVQVTI